MLFGDPFGYITTMRLARHAVLLCAGITCLMTSSACRKSPAPSLPELPTPHPVSNAKPTVDFTRKAIEIHRAAQEMALDGFQFGKNELGWPYEVGAVSSAGYFEKMIGQGFLSPEASGGIGLAWKIANLSDADPGETAFLELVQPDSSVLLIRKDGQWAVFRDETSAADFAKAPPREPFWLP
ncbi:MAG: hypothetical protein ACKOF3_11725 [Spartobacteria bacterium]